MLSRAAEQAVLSMQGMLHLLSEWPSCISLSTSQEGLTAATRANGAVGEF